MQQRLSTKDSTISWGEKCKKPISCAACATMQGKLTTTFSSSVLIPRPESEGGVLFGLVNVDWMFCAACGGEELLVLRVEMLQRGIF